MPRPRRQPARRLCPGTTLARHNPGQTNAGRPRRFPLSQTAHALYAARRKSGKRAWHRAVGRQRPGRMGGSPPARISGANMGKTRVSLIIGVCAVAVAVAGCEDGALTDRPAGEATAAADRPAAGRLVQEDVEAPEVFSRSEAGLWDGRPSLGGVWVAHPEVKDPERVIIRSAATGKVVIGALFRRERDNPGPRFMVSSDAAAALGLLAGQPSELTVVALRRREVAEPEPEAAGPEPAAEAATLEAPETVETAALAPAGEEAPVAADAAEDDAPITADAGSADTAEPERRGLLARLFAPREPETPAITAEARAAAASIPEGIEATVLEPTPASAPQPAAAPEPTPEPTPARAPSGLSRPFIQIGIFSVEANAERTATLLRRNGVVPTVHAEESQGRDFWRVVAGPAQSTADRTRLIAKVKELGFADAYAVPD